MRILIDATAVPADRGGVGRYVDGLVEALAPLVDIVVVCQRRDLDVFRALVPGVPLVAIGERWSRTPLRLIWEQLRLPAVAARAGADVIFSPHYTMPLLARRPRVVALHDATFFSDPQVHTPLKARFFRAWIRWSTRHADALVVPSVATGDEVRRYVRGGDDARFFVAPHGVDASVFHPPTPEEITRLREQLGIGDASWIAFLGTIEPRKNIPALVEAFGSVVAGRTEDAPVLVLAGARGWETALDDAIRALPSEARVVTPGYLPLERLRALLGGATLVAYPSLGEGFGLPVLEAMSSGAAVLTTRRLALPEVGGDAVAYAEPDAGALSRAISELLDDPRRRDELAALAVERAGLFTWRRSAEAHVRAFRAAEQKS